MIQMPTILKKLQMIHIWCNFTSKIKNYAKTKYIFLETK